MLKKIVKASIVFVLIGALFFVFPPRFSRASATNTANTTFQVNVKEVLSVSITTPTNWASGDINTLLRNKVHLEVTSNHIDGFTASMASTDSNARLYHSSKNTEYLIPLASSDVAPASFTANSWGFSIDDTDAGNSNSNYNAVATSSAAPNTLISRADSIATTPVTNRDIFFGASSDIHQASGTYSGTVNFYVVSGIIDNNTNPNPPTNPATNGSSTPTYANDRTVYTTTTDNIENNKVVSTTTTTTINEGNALSSYSDPAGVTDSTSSNIYDGSMLTTGLAITASVAAASGLIFFILAKRKKDDDEDEEETV